MAMNKTVTIQVNATMSGDMQSKLQAAENQINRFKDAAKFASAFGNNLGSALKYASDAAKMASNFGGDSKLAARISEYQKLQSQIEKFRQADQKAKETQAKLNRSVETAAKVKNQYKMQQADVARLKLQLEQLKKAKADAPRGQKSQFTAQIKELRAELKVSEQALKNIGREFQTSKSRSSNIGNDLRRQASALAELRGALSAAGVNVNRLEAAERLLQSSISSATAALDRQAQSLRQTQDLAARRANFSNAADNFSEKYSNFQNAVQTAETIMNPFTTAAQNAMSYEYELANIKALTQLKDIRAGNLEKVNAEMAEMDKVFRQLGATTEFTSTEIAGAAGKMAMSGWDTDTIKKAAPMIANLATATGTLGPEIVRLTDIFTDDMTAMGLKAGRMHTLRTGEQVEESQYFADTFTYALTNANLDKTSLHEGVKYFGPVAKQMGLSTAETFATAMITASAGIKNSQMGTAFRSGLIRLVAPTKGAEGAFAEMGLTMSDAQKQFREAGAELSKIGIGENATFLEKMQGIAQYLQTQDQAGRADFINKVFGKNAYTAWAVILENLESVAAIAKQAEMMDTTQIIGYAEDTAAVKRESALVQWEMLKSAWDANINQFGTALLPSIIQISENLSPILLSFSEWISKNQELVVLLAEVAAAISAIIVAAAGIQLISAAWGMVRASAFLAKEVIAQILTRLAAVSFASIGSAISSIGSAFLTAARGAMAFVLTPVGAVAMAAALAAYLIYDNWDKVGPVFESAADALKGAFGGAVEYVGELWDGLAEKFNKLKEFFHFDFGSDSPAKNAFDFSKNIPTYQSASLGNLTAPSQVATVAQVETVQPTLDLTKIQADIDFLGNSINNQAFNFENFNLAMQSKLDVADSSLAQIINTAESTVAQVETVQPALDLTKIQADIDFLGNSINNQAFKFESFNLAMQGKSDAVDSSLAQIINTAESTVAQVEGANTAISENAVNMANLDASVLGNTAEITTNTAEILNNTTVLRESITSIQNFAATADNSTASVENLASSANSAAMSLSGLGSAVSGAIASIQIAGANAAAAIPNSNVANNYSGGIYHGGAFLSWINEKGPEAIIPLDGSKRAVNLWQATGKILGVENNFAGNIFNSSGTPLNVDDFTFEHGEIWGQPTPVKLPNFEIPQIDIFSQIKDKIANVKNIFDGFNFESIFDGFKEIFGGFNFENVLEPIKNMFNLEIISKAKEIFGGFNFESIFQDIFKPVPTFPEIGTANNAESQQSFQPNFTFNITVNSKNAEEFREQIPEIEKSFEEQFESYMNEWQRRNFAW